MDPCWEALTLAPSAWSSASVTISLRSAEQSGGTRAEVDHHADHQPDAEPLPRRPRQPLLTYCQLDTLAMVRVHEELVKIL